MIFKTQITKKFLATSATLAILGSTISMPINVLSAEAAEAVQTAVATTVGPELINKDTSIENNRFKNYTVAGGATGTFEPMDGMDLTGTNPSWFELGGQRNVVVAKANPFSYYIHEVSAMDQATGYTTVTIDTTVGKTYAFSYSYTLANYYASTASANSMLLLATGVLRFDGNPQNYKTYNKAGNLEGSTTGSDTIEFKATDVKTTLYMHPTYTKMNEKGGQHYASLTNTSVKQINTEVDTQEEARLAVNKLFNNGDPGAAIKTLTDQAAIHEAQLLVYKVTDTNKKSELQVLINRAQNQLNARLAIANLFENGNVNGKIKASTDQAAVNAAQNLVDKVAGNLGKSPLQTDLNKAKNQLASLENEAEIARQDAAVKAVKALFNNDNVAGTIKSSLTQNSIENAKGLVAAVTDLAKKAELTAQIAEAQKQLDAKTTEASAEQARQEAAKKAVEGLFNNNDVTGAIKGSTTQAAINNAKNLVAAVTDVAKKKVLEAQIAEAQKQLDAKTTEALAEQARQEAAKKAVEGLFNNNDVTGTIKNNTTQEAINNAKELVATIQDAGKKAILEAQITEAQKQLTAKSELTGKVDIFTLQKDRYLTGTYSGTGVSAMSVDVNGVRYYGGTVKDGTFSFYALDKIWSAGDIVTVNLHGADKSIKKSFPVTIKAATKITQNAYQVKDSNITGTFDNLEITKMNIKVNDVTYWGGTLANGEFKFYALDKITSATDVVSLNFYNAQNELIISKNLTISAPVVTSGEITSANLAVGDKNIVGTITGDIKSFGVIIDGTTYNGGTVAADGTFKFYVADKKFAVGSAITIIGYDKSKNILSEMTLPVTK
ncbi:hypothetical protein HCJ39_12320 [Listeria rocourtiae]|uniref:immunoglobulin-like domain-containing protein n=1 Tax=Listeria rocourtiae TaxID=647910 RepID=UPI001628CA8D|nr:immunoglobulin-like domain-containing protein [Listeria rocourtiae]MBC1605498.1 hypothetical protein [Listeria rocourtiae]